MRKQTLTSKFGLSVMMGALLCSVSGGTAAATPSGPSTPPPVSRPARSLPKSGAYSPSSSKARKERLERARAAAVQARQLRDVKTPRYRVDESGREVPDPRAEAAIIYDPETGQVLWGDHAEDQRSMASITKVMTALVFLDSGADLSMPVTVANTDTFRASTTYLRRGYKVTASDLLNLLLVGSDNAAARALARVSPYGSDGFIDQMNAKAASLGLAATHYADPSGLLADNVSTAYDLARLIAYAAGDERVGGIMRKTSYTTYSGRSVINAHATNQLVKVGDLDVLGGKTGFISRSGYCLASLLRLPDTGQQVAVVVLGAKSNAGRFWETRHLFNWLTGRSAADASNPAQDHQP